MEKLNIIKMLFNRYIILIFLLKFKHKDLTKNKKLEFPTDIYRWDLIQHIF